MRPGRPIEIIGTAMDGPSGKCAEEALRESEERYRALIEVSPQMVWVARADGSNIFWNQRWYDYTGLTPAESEGFDWMQAVHPEHRDQCAEFFRQGPRIGRRVEQRGARAPGCGRAVPLALWSWPADPRRPTGGSFAGWASASTFTTGARRKQALQRSEAWLSEAQRVSQHGKLGDRPSRPGR